MPQLLWVKEVLVGGGYTHKKLDIKGRGKMGVIHVPKSNIKIYIEERPMNFFYKMCLLGRAPPALGESFKSMLYEKNASFDEVLKYSHLTTAQGRRYRRE